MSEWVAVLDFGSQYTQLIARRVRELGIYSEILPCHAGATPLRKRKPTAVILSGGPASVHEEGSPKLDPGVLDLGVPILGICYGLQVLTAALGGRVHPATEREYGLARVEKRTDDTLLSGMPEEFPVWMSHGDRVETLPEGFLPLGASKDSPYAVVAHPDRRLYGVQFHPEVTHTPDGRTMLKNFLFGIARCRGEWKLEDFIDQTVAETRVRVGDASILMALSGGVDSSVAAALLSQAVGRRLHCVFVDNGVLRKGERAQVEEFFRDHFEFSLHTVDAGARFLGELAGIEDPERKRKIIGRLFVDIFKEEALKIPDAHFLAQGTLYPDVIESQSAFGGPSATIKTHHNVGGLPEELGFELIEPFRLLFKDEVREIGRKLGVPERIVGRHPFPGPGLAVRIPGEVTAERVRVLQEADALLLEEIRAAGWYDRLWQAFGVLLPVRSVGVMGDQRTYEQVLAIRAVESTDGMTADWAKLPPDLLGRISNRIINEVRGINRVLYDVSSKPPATIEFE